MAEVTQLGFGGGDFYIVKSWQQIWNEIDDKVRSMKPGEHFMYHHGYLAIDRETDPEIDAIAERFCFHGTQPNFAFGHGCFSNGAGLGRLTQKRLGNGEYLYMFTKNRRQQRASDTY